MRPFLTKIFCIVCAYFFSIGARAQIIDTRACTPTNHLIITKDVQFFKSVQPISFDSVLKKTPQSQFSPLPDQPVVYLGYDPCYYWFRFVLNNKDSTAKTLLLLMGPLGMRDAELYRITNGKAQWISKTGNQYPFKERPYLYTHYVLPLPLSPASIDTFYLRMDERGNFKTFSFALLEPNALKLIENRVYFSFGIMIGVLLLFAIFNLYLFISIDETIHFWYSLYILLLIFLLMKNEGLDEQFLHLDSETGYRLTPLMGVGALTIGMLMHVIQLFLVNINRSSFLYKATRFIKYALFLFAAAHFVVFYFRPGYKVEGLVFHLADKTTIVGILAILTNCIYSVAKGSRPAIFVLVGIIVFLLGSLERLLVISTSSYLLPPSMFQVGMLIETIIISFGLMYRYNSFKKEKEHYALQLEKQTLESTKQILLAQEAEQKRIASDLHDELGGNLAAIKMTLQSFDLPAPQLTIVNHLIDNASDNARHIAHNLMPPEFEQAKLVELLSARCQRLSTQQSCNLRFYTSGRYRYFSKQSELMIYRIFMELANNIVKHSKATEATLQLIYHDEYLELMAEDNGIGISEKQHNGMGLRNIRSRVNYLKGSMVVDSKAGTTIIIQIPYQENRTI